MFPHNAVVHNAVMKKAPLLLFKRAEGYAPVTFLLSGILASFHTV